MSFTPIPRRAARRTLLASLAVGIALATSGYSSPATSGPSGSAGNAASSSSTPASASSYTLTFDAAASLSGRPRTAPESTMTAAWFPPAGTTGLTQVADKALVKELAQAASANPKFWIQRPNDHAQPVVYGADARALLGKSEGFATALIVPVYAVAPTRSLPATPDLAIPADAKPVSYQVILSGNVGDSSFGVRPGSAPGEWLLDPNGELLNWGNAIDAVSRKIGTVAESAFITRSAFDLAGKPELYVTWAVFRDDKGKRYAVTLHNPPPITAAWQLAGRPLRVATVYDTSAIFGPVTISATK